MLPAVFQRRINRKLNTALKTSNRILQFVLDMLVVYFVTPVSNISKVSGECRFWFQILGSDKTDTVSIENEEIARAYTVGFCFEVL